MQGAEVGTGVQTAQEGRDGAAEGGRRCAYGPSPSSALEKRSDSVGCGPKWGRGGQSLSSHLILCVPG